MIRNSIIYKLIDIDSINKDSPVALLNAMYQCENYALLDENKDLIVNAKSFNYKSSFYLSFIADKDSISEEYLKARKALYKLIAKIKQEQAKALQDLDLKQRESYNLQRKQTQARFSTQKDKVSPLILESKDKSIKIIFLSQGIAPCSSLRDLQGKSW